MSQLSIHINLIHQYLIMTNTFVTFSRTILFLCCGIFLTSCLNGATDVRVSSVSLNVTAVEVEVDDYYVLKATVSPNNATNKSVIWSTNNASVATVEDGVVTALKVGTAVITVKSDDGGLTDNCKVKVVAKGEGSGEGNGNDDVDGDVDGDGDGDGDENLGDITGFENLSAIETANSYVVTKAGNYKFTPTKGNSASSVGTIASAEVVWETFGTTFAPAKGDLIKKVAYKDNSIAFVVADEYKKGNALIVAKDAGGNILWSWHIWMTDQPKEHVYKNNAGTLMDRNLGALTATAYDPLSTGLLYQWGRKDPFLGLAEIPTEEGYGVSIASTLEWPEYTISTSQTGTVEYSILNPTTFITCNPESLIYDEEYNDWRNDYDWLNREYSHVERWSSTKTIYDPCPAGWRVPDPIWETAGIPVCAFRDFGNYVTADYRGFIVGKEYCSHDAWYPASGMRVYWEIDDNKYEYILVSGYGSYWSTSDEGILYGSWIYADSGSWDGYYDGHSVRCQKL